MSQAWSEPRMIGHAADRWDNRPGTRTLTAALSASPLAHRVPPVSASAIAKLSHYESFDDQGGDVVVLGSRKSGDAAELGPIARSFDEKCGGLLTRMVETHQVEPEAGKVVTTALPPSSGYAMAVLLGLGSHPSRDDAYQAGAIAIRKLAGHARRHVVFALSDQLDAAQHDAVVAGSLAGMTTQGLYQSDSSFHVPESIAFDFDPDAVKRGGITGEAINLAKELVNSPANVIYPESFADHATEVAADVGLQIEVWDRSRLEQEDCRAILAVGQGSSKDPRLVILKHHGGQDGDAPIAIVGKGVTFDSGGLSLKPSAGMTDMKCDMAGAANVLAVMRAIAEMNLPINVIGLCGLAENMVSGDSYKLGDVIETRSGKTIEILNTDAEGRVVLADTLNVTLDHQPSAIVDMATLTGACMVALGMEVIGSMSRHDDLAAEVMAAAKAEGEPMWPLPMFELYDDKVKSKVADIRNIGAGRWGGAITAAKFLQHFVGDVPWVHLDIAGPAFADSATPARDAGATGAAVRTMIRWLINRSRAS